MPDTLSAGSPKSAKGLIIGIVVVLLLAAAGWYLYSSGGLKAPSTPSGQPGTGEQTGETTPEPSPTPNEVFSYVGEVTAVGNGQITVMAKKDVNLLEADATLTVKADANTQVIRRTIPRVLPADGNATGLFSQENIALSDVAVGDQVTVVSTTNLRGVTEFTASRVEVLNVQ